MPLIGFEGPAGTGKTHSLLAAIRQRLAAQPLLPHQKILALTFMHGSRRRLDESFSSHPETRGRVVCLTIDSFAGNLLSRWRSIAGPMPLDFDDICDAAGALLERSEIAAWVARSFPIIAIDEAQELAPCRLRIIQALERHTHMFAAADEFQCLDEDVDTGPFLAWFATGEVSALGQVHRTDRAGLINAGVALRRGQAPVIGAGLNIRSEFPAQAPFAIGHVLNAARGSTAILVAPGATGWVNEMIPRWIVGMQTPRQQVRPMRVGWVSSPNAEAETLGRRLCPDDDVEADHLIRDMQALEGAPKWITAALASIIYRRRAFGIERWSQADLIAIFERRANHDRAFGRRTTNGVQVMSIHGAKNQQFRNVVVLWPHGVRGTEELKRRLLYNAITRAQHQCTVFLRAEALGNQPPFV